MRLPRNRRPAYWDLSMTQQFSWNATAVVTIGTIIVGKQIGRIVSPRTFGKGQKLGVLKFNRKAKLFLSENVDDINNGGSQRKLSSDVDKIHKNIEFEAPTPQVAASVDEETIGTTTEMFRTITASKVEEIATKENK